MDLSIWVLPKEPSSSYFVLLALTLYKRYTTLLMDPPNLDLDSCSSTPSLFSSLLEAFGSTSNFRHTRNPSQTSSFSGESSFRWSLGLQQNSYGQSDSYTGSPLAQSGLLPEQFRSTSLISSYQQLEDLKIHCGHLTQRNTALEAEVDTIK